MWGALLALALPMGLYFANLARPILDERGSALLTFVALCLPLALAGFFAIGFARRTRVDKNASGSATGWTLLGLGFWACMIGEAWTYLHLYATGEEVLSPHLTDAFYFASYLLPIFGAFCLVSSLNRPRIRQIGLDALIVAVGIGTALWSLLLYRLLATTTSSPLATTIAVGYPVMVILKVWAVSVLLVATWGYRPWRTPLLLMFAGTSIYATSDILWSFSIATRTFQPIGWIDGGWALGYSVIAWGMLVAWNSRSAPDAVAFEKSTPTIQHPLAKLGHTAPVVLGVVGVLFVTLLDLNKPAGIEKSTLFSALLISVFVGLRQVIALSDQTREIQQLNVHLEERVAQRTQQIESRYRWMKAVQSSMEIHEVVHEGVEFGVMTLKADAAFLRIFTGISPKRPEGVVAWNGTDQLAGVDFLDWMENRSPLLESIQERFRAPDGTEQRYHLLRIPLRNGNELIGAFHLVRIGRGFSAEERFEADAIGLEIASMIARILLYERAIETSERDYLTKLLNHRAISQRFQELFHQGQDQPEVGLILLDVGNFKLFNDTYGHPAGDDVLRCLAKALNETVRNAGFVGRTGGDEFMIVLPGMNLRHTYRSAALIQSAVKNLNFKVKGGSETLPILINMGIASSPETSSNPYNLIAKADRQLSEAKRSQVEYLDLDESLNGASERVTQSIDMVEMLLHAIDNMDSYTRRHSEDVTQYASWISEELGDSPETTMVVAQSAMMHDIGKIAVPGQILRKPGALSEEEFDVVKRHPVVGSMIASAIPGAESLIDGVLYHHERWDGKGYPEGLSGLDIPYLGRLLAVADAFSAMTTDRTYRKGLAYEEAARRIQAGIGTQFCPECAAAFLRALQRRGYIGELGDSDSSTAAA